MGLDISGYKKATLVRAVKENPTEDDYNEMDRSPGYCLQYLYSTGFPERADGMVDGIYLVSVGENEQTGFRAGSYGGYNIWREALAQMIGTTPERVWKMRKEKGATLPFYELIRFANNEGFIGPKTSAKLAKDFAEHHGKAERFGKTLHGYLAESFFELYEQWQEAFELAAGEGVVKFH